VSKRKKSLRILNNEPGNKENMMDDAQLQELIEGMLKMEKVTPEIVKAIKPLLDMYGTALFNSEGFKDLRNEFYKVNLAKAIMSKYSNLPPEKVALKVKELMKALGLL